MLQHFLQFNGVEIVNTARLNANLAATGCASCQINCECLGYGFLPPDFDPSDVTRYPWHDSSTTHNRVLSEDFYGIGAVETVLYDPTKYYPETDRVSGGRIFSQPLYKGLETKWRVLLYARTMAAAQYGFDWLTAIVNPDRCNHPGHPSSCGLADAVFYTACPSNQTEADSYRRYQLNSVISQGPTVVEMFPCNGLVAWEITFSVASERGQIFGEVLSGLNFPVTTTYVFRDDEYQNLIKNPNTFNTYEPPEDNTMVMTNWARNPSVEVSELDFSYDYVAVSGDSTTQVHAQMNSAGGMYAGWYSYRVRLKDLHDSGGFGQTGTGIVRGWQSVPLEANRLPGYRVMIHVWAAAVIYDSTPGTITDLTASVIWLDAAGNPIDSPVVLGTIPEGDGRLAGYSFNATELLVPVDAETARVMVAATVTNWRATYDGQDVDPDNTDMELVIDGVAVIN